ASSPVRLGPRGFEFRSVGPDEVLSLSASIATVCRWSARLGRRFGISVWLGPLRPAACPSTGTAPESNVRAAVGSRPANHPSASGLGARVCVDPPNDSVAISTLAHPCLHPQPTHQ